MPREQMQVRRPQRAAPGEIPAKFSLDILENTRILSIRLVILIFVYKEAVP